MYKRNILQCLAVKATIFPGEVVETVTFLLPQRNIMVQIIKVKHPS
jgi:hypothetical protein